MHAQGWRGNHHRAPQQTSRQAGTGERIRKDVPSSRRARTCAESFWILSSLIRYRRTSFARGKARIRLAFDETKKRDTSARVRHTDADADGEVHVSAVATVERATKVGLGTLDAVCEIAQRYEELMTASLFVALPLSQRHALAAGRMAGEHCDSFDRLFAAQAHIKALPLATIDPAFRHFGVKTIW